MGSSGVFGEEEINSEEEIIFNKPVAEHRNCLMYEKESFSSHQPVIVKEDPYNVIIQELKDQEEWMADFVRQTKPKKKLNKKQIRRDIFEIDFMCD